MARPKKYPDELIQRGIRLALESGRPIAHVAADLGIHPETLRKRVRQAEALTAVTALAPVYSTILVKRSYDHRRLLGTEMRPGT